MGFGLITFEGTIAEGLNTAGTVSTNKGAWIYWEKKITCHVLSDFYIFPNSKTWDYI